MSQRVPVIEILRSLLDLPPQTVKRSNSAVEKIKEEQAKVELDGEGEEGRDVGDDVVEEEVEDGDDVFEKEGDDDAEGEKEGRGLDEYSDWVLRRGVRQKHWRSGGGGLFQEGATAGVHADARDLVVVGWSLLR